MTREWDDLTPDLRSQLSELLRSAAPDSDADWPSMESLWSFVTGTADDATRETVQASLAGSASLRGFLAEWSRQTEPWTDDERAALRQVAMPDSRPLAARLDLGSRPVETVSVAERIRAFFWSPMTGYALAAALAVLSFLPRGASMIAPLQPARGLSLIAIDAGNVMRGGDPPAAQLPAGTVALTVWLPVDAAPAEGATYALELADEAGQVLQEYDLPAPERMDGSWASVVTLEPAALPDGPLTLTVMRSHPEEDPRGFAVRIRR